ncbi:MAG: dihydrolipoyl dehydrogenase [Planctomycetota bacterium]
MSVELKIPEAGESITEVFVARWHKQPGEAVKKDETIVEIETDKASMELPSPVDGVLGPLLKNEGDAAQVGDVIATIEAGAVADAPAKAAEPAKAAAGAAKADEKKGGAKGGHVMPAARRVLDERGIDAADVEGTGPGGRVLKEDAVAHRAESKPAPAPEKTFRVSEDAAKANGNGHAIGSREVEVVPMTPMRRTIARRLVEAQQTAALLTTFNEVDMTEVMRLRGEFKDSFLEKHGVKLGFTSFFVKAVVEALKLTPALNAQIHGTDVHYHNYFDIGIAVGGGKGLVVPIIRNAECLSFAEIEKTVADFGSRAKENRIGLEELQGGTFTISNGGVYGSLNSTPILNPPQSGVLGLHAIQERPVGLNGQIVLRPMMYVALTYDHRIVDGREAVTFLKHIKMCVENPRASCWRSEAVVDAYDLIVIGAGPGGYVASIRAAQLGLKVACVDKNPTRGGTCLRVGCIPSKALLESSELYAKAAGGLGHHGIELGKVKLDLEAMMARKDKIVERLTGGVDLLLKNNGVALFEGMARILSASQVEVTGPSGDAQTLDTSRILIATGSNSAPLRGVDLSAANIATSTEAIAWDRVPKELVVIGAGAIGLELGSVWSRLGSKVTVLEYQDVVLPGMDRDISREALKLFKRQGLSFKLKCRVTKAAAKRSKVVVECEGDEPVIADKVLLAVGRMPNTEGLGLENIGLATNERGFIPIDEHFRTAVDDVYAIGDVVPGPMLAHKAEDEGMACAEFIATGHGHVNYDAIPNVVYTHPEVASVGRTEQQLAEAGVPVKTGKFHFRVNGRAMALDETDGFVKVIAHAETDRVLGVHIIGPRAGDLIAEATAAIEFGASAEDIARTCHAHPTLPEVLKEAALDVDSRAIHKV